MICAIGCMLNPDWQYAINKSRLRPEQDDERWQERIVAQLDSAMTKWIDSVPEHCTSPPIHFLPASPHRRAHSTLEPRPGKHSLLETVRDTPSILLHVPDDHT